MILYLHKLMLRGGKTDQVSYTALPTIVPPTTLFFLVARKPISFSLFWSIQGFVI